MNLKIVQIKTLIQKSIENNVLKPFKKMKIKINTYITKVPGKQDI